MQCRAPGVLLQVAADYRRGGFVRSNSWRQVTGWIR